MIHIHLSAHGIGDAVTGLYAACGLADAGREVVYHCRKSEWFPGVSHPGVTVLPFRGETGIDAAADYDGQTRAAAAGTCASRAQWYCDNIAKSSDLPPFAPARPRAVKRPPPVIPPGYALIAPYAHNDKPRDWPEDRWREFAERLGGRVVVIGENHKRPRLRALFGRSCEVHWDKSPAWVTSAVANADHSYGNDSGMSHLAGLYGVPGTVVMTAFPFRFVFGEAPSLAGVGGCGRGMADIGVREVMAAGRRPVDVGRVVREKLGQRAATTEWLFAELRERFPHPRVVETGCVRSPDDWSAGYFTWLCGAVLETHGGELVSVDNDAGHCATSRSLCGRWSRVSVVEADSVTYLLNRTEPIDLAYLDSLDTDRPGCAEHGLTEAQAGERLMSDRGLIVFDDTPKGAGGYEGKGRLAVEWLQSQGWVVRPESGYQTVLERG
jgi:heptosyltransferase-1